jgi:excisionase family DNA binding protein
MSTGSDTTLGTALRYAAERLLEAADAADRTRLPELLTPKQAAEVFQVSQQTVYRWIQSGRLEAKQIGDQYRIPADAIRRLGT